MRSKILVLVITLLAATPLPPVSAEEPVPIPRPDGISRIGTTPEGYPIYGPVPAGDGAPIAIPDNPVSIPRPDGISRIGTTPEGYPIYGPVTPVAPPLRVNLDGSRVEADGTLTPAPLFNPDGTPYGGAPVLKIPGATSAAPFGFKQDGTPVPPPLFNPDGSPFVLGVSPMPVPQLVTGTPFGYDAMGKPVPAPLWNPDGTPYVHGVSKLPDVPAIYRQPISLSDPAAIKVVNQEIIAADLTAIKKKGGYLLDTDDQISFVDKSLTITAVRKGRKTQTLTLSVDAEGNLFIPTAISLRGYTIKIKRGDLLLKDLKG